MLSLNTSHKKANMSCNLQWGQFKIKLAEDLFPHRHKPVSFESNHSYYYYPNIVNNKCSVT